MTNIEELRQSIAMYGLEATCADDLLGLLNRLEAAEKERNVLKAKVERMEKEREALRTALEKIADWDSAWGPYPETNEAWRAMVIVTAREAVPQRGEKK